MKLEMEIGGREGWPDDDMDDCTGFEGSGACLV